MLHPAYVSGETEEVLKWLLLFYHQEPPHTHTGREEAAKLRQHPKGEKREAIIHRWWDGGCLWDDAKKKKKA